MTSCQFVKCFVVGYDHERWSVLVSDDLDAVQEQRGREGAGHGEGQGDRSGSEWQAGTPLGAARGDVAGGRDPAPRSLMQFPG